MPVGEGTDVVLNRCYDLVDKFVCGLSYSLLS